MTAFLHIFHSKAFFLLKKIKSFPKPFLVVGEGGGGTNGGFVVLEIGGPTW